MFDGYRKVMYLFIFCQCRKSREKCIGYIDKNTNICNNHSIRKRGYIIEAAGDGKLMTREIRA